MNYNENEESASNESEEKIRVRRTQVIDGKIIFAEKDESGKITIKTKPLTVGNQTQHYQVLKKYKENDNEYFYSLGDGSGCILCFTENARCNFDQVKNNIASNIKALRLFNEMTCDELAEDVDVTRQYIGQIESSKRNLTLETLFKIANFFEIDAYHIMYAEKREVRSPEWEDI